MTKPGRASAWNRQTRQPSAAPAHTRWAGSSLKGRAEYAVRKIRSGWDKDPRHTLPGIYERVCAPAQGPEPVPFPDGFPRTSMGWPITPDSLEWGVRFLGERYGLPMAVSENGMANLDRIFRTAGAMIPCGSTS